MPRLSRVAWVHPTLRLIPWSGLALPIGAAALVGLLVRLGDGGMPGQVRVAALAAAAAAVPQVLDDPAHHLLSSVPHSRRRRIGHRLVLVLPVLVVAWLLVAPLVIDGADSAASVGPLLALAAIGLAGGCLAARARPELAAAVGTAIPLSVVALQLVLEDRVAQADLLDVWIDHPWATAVVAGLVSLVSLRETGPLVVSTRTPTGAMRHARTASPVVPTVGMERRGPQFTE